MSKAKAASKSTRKFNETVRVELAWKESKRNPGQPGRCVSFPKDVDGKTEYERQCAFIHNGLTNKTEALLSKCAEGASNVTVLTPKQAEAIKDALVKVGKLFRNSGEELGDYMATGAFHMAMEVGRLIWLSKRGKLDGNVELRLVATKKQS